MAEPGALKEWLPLLTALMSFATALFVWWSTRETKKAVQEVHLVVNSRMDELLKVTREAEHAKGMLEGVKEGEAVKAQTNTSTAEPPPGMPDR